jgi:hypothetical protein
METAGISGVRQPPRRQSAVLKCRHSALARVTEAAKLQSDAGARLARLPQWRRAFRLVWHKAANRCWEILTLSTGISFFAATFGIIATTPKFSVMAFH